MAFHLFVCRFWVTSRITRRASWREMRASKFPTMHNPTESALPSDASCRTEGSEPRLSDLGPRWRSTETPWEMRYGRSRASSDRVPISHRYLPLGVSHLAQPGLVPGLAITIVGITDGCQRLRCTPDEQQRRWDFAPDFCTRYYQTVSRARATSRRHSPDKA